MDDRDMSEPRKPEPSPVDPLRPPVVPVEEPVDPPPQPNPDERPPPVTMAAPRPGAATAAVRG